MESPTATELALPGLEEARVVTDPSPQHYIERGPLKRLMVFAGRSHPDLAQNIAEKLGVELGDVELETFENVSSSTSPSSTPSFSAMFWARSGCERPAKTISRFSGPRAW